MYIILLHFTGLHINRTSEESIYNWIRYEYAKVYLIVVAKAPSVELKKCILFIIIITQSSLKTFKADADQ